MFVDSYNADGEDNFLSVNGKSRKEKRAAKKAEKEEKLRQRKGAEIDAKAKEAIGGMLGLPMMPLPPAEEKKGLKKVVSNLKDKREQRQADKLFKKDYEKSKKEGTLSKAEFPATKEKKTVNVMDTLSKGVGSVKNLLLGEDEDPAPKKKSTNGGDIAKWVILGLGAAALVVIFVNGRKKPVEQFTFK